MTRSQKEPLVEYILEIERKLTALRKAAYNIQSQEQSSHMNLNQEQVPRQLVMETRENMEEEYKTLREWAAPTFTGTEFSIMRPTVNANNFEIKPAVITMIQSNQFGGLPHEDPNGHIRSFLEICDTFRYNGVSEDAVRLRLFPFSLQDKAKS